MVAVRVDNVCYALPFTLQDLTATLATTTDTAFYAGGYKPDRRELIEDRYCGSDACRGAWWTVLRRLTSFVVRRDRR